jgi:AcrR family transcriptional regulator
MRQHRLAACDRREAIMNAVREVFAEKGFDATTTRELAKAAGVSEALLYRHFPSKESLYTAMCESCLSGKQVDEYKQILALEPSSSTLVLLTHFLVSKMVFEMSKDKKSMDLLVVRSLMSDGDFLRAKHKGMGSAWHQKFRESIATAVKAGEMGPATYSDSLTSWMAQSVGLGMMLFLRPSQPVVDFEISRKEITERCVRFVLLGVGMKAEIIQKHYNAKALALLGAD